jgi:hypothetical protein
MKKHNLSSSITLGAALLLLVQITQLAYAGNLVPLLDLSGGGFAT